MQIIGKASVLFIFAMSLATIQLSSTEATAQSSYFTSRGCVDCHATPVVASCNGCHYHGNRSLRAATNKTSYAPGETVTVTLTTSSTRSGWIRAILYDQNNTQLAVSSGNASGMGGSTTFPAALTAPAPTTPGTYTWKMAYFGNSANSGDVHGEVVVNANSFTVAAAAIAPAKIGVYSNGLWYLDADGSGAWNGTPTDRQPFLGFAGANPVAGDWNGNGTIKIGVYDNKETWYLDLNNNGIWDGSFTDRQLTFGFAGATPVTGDWNGTGTTKIGVYANGTWYLDLNGNGSWDGANTDRLVTFGFAGAVPVTGDWDGDGVTEIGVYDKGTWLLDLNGNGVWDGAVTDRQTVFGYAGAVPVTGDWNADGTTTEIGVFDNGLWYLDLNGNGSWNGESTDRLTFFGFTGALPIAGKW